MKRLSDCELEQHYDLLVCGGGIYGAWAAYDAALRGLKVMLVEQNDWASGTSSASSKLIHGGLRYLQTLDFGLVKKSLLERQHLIHCAPYRVWPLRFGVPVHGYLEGVRLKIALMIYDFLAGAVQAQQSHHYFSGKTFACHFPALDRSKFTAGYTYQDAQTDDARLVIEVVDGAQSASACCLNYCQLQEVIEVKGVVKGAVLYDKVSNKTLQIKASALVKTTGRWIAGSSTEKHWGRLSKGIHLVLPKIQQDQALLLMAKSDGRVFFVIPWYGRTLLGTTDSNYSGDIDHVKADSQEIEYLLTEANSVLNTQWTSNDIQGQFAGVRVLQCSPRHSPSSVSRDWALKSPKLGLYYSIGGKLTSSREDASYIVDAVCDYLGNNSVCNTDVTAMPWLPNQNFTAWQIQNTEKAQILGVDDESTLWLLRRHGKRVADIFLSIEQDEQGAQRVTPDVPLIIADLLFCLKNEMVVHLEDLLRRRVPLFILYRMTEVELKHFALLCGKELHWDQATIEQEIKFCASKWLMR